MHLKEILVGGHLVKLISIEKSKNSKKKYDAHFRIDGKHDKIVSFGSGPDFIDHQDNDKKAHYLKENTEEWYNPDTEKALNRWILWNKEDLDTSEMDFRRRFYLGRRT